jgi:hypothetical protein
MVRCELGYLCEVCGLEVEDLTGSDLYLRYVLGEVDPEMLHIHPERHIRCNPLLAQFIVAEGFDPVSAAGAFDKMGLDPVFVAAEEARVTRGYHRLLELPGLGLPIREYPLPEVRPRWQCPDPDPAPDASHDQDHGHDQPAARPAPLPAS